MEDANGYNLNDGDRVFSYELDSKRCYGTLCKGETFRSNQDWYVEYDDGEEFIVLDFSALYRADKY